MKYTLVSMLAAGLLTLSGCGGSSDDPSPSTTGSATTVAVPNVAGDAQTAATSGLTAAGLKVGTVTTASSATVASGDVVSETPAVGASVASGSAIALVVSSGPASPPPAAVPNLVGATQTAATSALTAAGLTVGTVTQASSSTVPAGDVISQNPAVGTSVASGSAVALVVSSGPAAVAEWTWENGTAYQNGYSVYGTVGVAAAGIWPGGRSNSGTWVDASGTFWLYGGTGPGAAFADLWKYSAGKWTWVSGLSGNQNSNPPVFGSQGVATAGNTPGALITESTWVDASGNLWLFGGNGQGATQGGQLNDLWEYSGNQWTWVSGTSSPNVKGVYGTEGVAAASNLPGGRGYCYSWIDSHGNFWMFGGTGVDTTNTLGPLDDVWTYPATN